MTDLLAARLQMAVSLGFHIIFAAIGVAMPFLMAVAHLRWLQTRRPVFRELTKVWSKGVAIFFATGAVSGTVLSFELGLLWPNFMRHAGAIIGMPFSLEGAAFFLEAIFLGIFLYGWDRVPERIHWLSGMLVGLSGVTSAFVVITANGWMNSPAGFEWVNGRAENIDPLKAMFNRAALPQGVHMTIASFAATGFGAASLHALGLLRNRQSLFHREALKIALLFGGIASVLQPFSGDWSAKSVAERQPLKLAAMEAQFETASYAPLRIGGLPNEEAERVDYALEIPGLLSFLAYGKFDAEVRGLSSFPRDERPPVFVVHAAFQLMVACGSVLAALSIIAFVFFRRGNLERPWLLGAIAIAGPLGFLAIEAGWTVTEVGRQPWIIYGIMRTKDALTPMPGLIVPFMLFSGVYVLLSLVLVMLMVRQFRNVS